MGRRPPYNRVHKGREAVNARSILASLVALAAVVSADTSGSLPAPAFPALSAAHLVYVLVPDPLGASTWVEQQIEAARLGTGAGTRDDRASADVLVAFGKLHAPIGYALEIPEAPPDMAWLPAAEPVPEADKPEERRMLGALDAMGLKPEDLVEAPELPAAATALADILARVDALIFARGRRARGSEVASFRVDPGTRYVKQPSYVRYKKPQGDAEPMAPPLTLHAKRVTRSLYKVLLGVAIGILIWACGVRPPPALIGRAPPRTKRAGS